MAQCAQVADGGGNFQMEGNYKCIQ